MFFFKQGRHMSIIYEEPNNPRPDRLYHVRVQMVEVKEKHTLKKFLMILFVLRLSSFKQLWFSDLFYELKKLYF